MTEDVTEEEPAQKESAPRWSVWRNIWHRRLPQIFGVFVGAFWLSVEITDWAVARYTLSPVLPDVVATVVLCLLPAVLIIGYYHGAPGRDEWTRGQVIGVVVNVILALALVFVVFGGEDLGAAATEITVTNELGETETKVVPRSSFRRRVLIPFWTYANDEDEAAVRGTGLAVLLAYDLGQSAFVNANTPLTNYEYGIFPALQRQGYTGDGPLPLSLAQRVAIRYDYDHLLDARVSRAAGRLSAEVVLYQLEPFREVASYSVSAATPFELVDLLSPRIKADLGVPVDDALSNDLPVAELVTGSESAFQRFTEGARARVIDNDYETATAAWERAVELDPGFALAYGELTNAHLFSGDIEKARTTVAQALAHDYRLPSEDEYLLKGVRYAVQGQMDKRMALFEMWTELEPENFTATLALTEVRVIAGDTAGAIAELERARTIAPGRDFVLQLLGRLYQIGNRLDDARRQLEAYAELNPDDPDAWRQLARLARQEGDLEGAIALNERAALLADDDIRPTLELSRLHLALGHWPRAEQFAGEAESLAVTPAQRYAVAQARMDIRFMQGRIADILVLLDEADSEADLHLSPLDRLLQIEVSRATYLQYRGDYDAAHTLILGLDEALQPPLDAFSKLLLAGWYVETGESARAGDLLPGIAQVFEDQLPVMRYALEALRCELRMAEEAYAEAAEHCRSSLQLFTSSPLADASPLVAWSSSYAGLATAQRLSGDLAAAEDTLTEGLERLPADPLLELELAWLRLAQGETQAARSLAAEISAAWSDADPRYVKLAVLAELADRLER